MTSHKNKLIALNRTSNQSYLESSRDRQPLTERTNTFNLSQSPSGINRESVSTSSLHQEMLKTFGNNENDIAYQYTKKEKGSSFLKSQSVVDTVGSLISTNTVIIPRPGEKKLEEFLAKIQNESAEKHHNFDWRASIGPFYEKMEEEDFPINLGRKFLSKENTEGTNKEKSKESFISKSPRLHI
jgi:hypothetical protein